MRGCDARRNSHRGTACRLPGSGVCVVTYGGADGVPGLYLRLTACGLRVVYLNGLRWCGNECAADLLSSLPRRLVAEFRRWGWVAGGDVAVESRGRQGTSGIFDHVSFTLNLQHVLGAGNH